MVFSTLWALWNLWEENEWKTKAEEGWTALSGLFWRIQQHLKCYCPTVWARSPKHECMSLCRMISFLILEIGPHTITQDDLKLWQSSGPKYWDYRHTPASWAEIQCLLCTLVACLSVKQPNKCSFFLGENCIQFPLKLPTSVLPVVHWPFAIEYWVITVDKGKGLGQRSHVFWKNEPWQW